jgi:hypothetical protein
MAESKTEQPSRKARRARFERRFVPASSTRAILSLVGTVVGGLVLGAGIYSQWLSATPLAQASWIVGAGAVLLAAVILWGDFGGMAVRVGDAGVGLERAGQPLVRIAWNTVRSVSIKAGELRVESPDREIRFPVATFPAAAAWVVKEARRRIPKKVDLDESQRTALPAAQEGDGTQLPLEKLQVAGQKCRASGKLITFERDARLCPKCSEVYHHDSVPEACLTCEADLKALKGKSASAASEG